MKKYEITEERLSALDELHRIAAEILIERGEYILVGEPCAKRT